MPALAQTAHQFLNVAAPLDAVGPLLIVSSLDDRLNSVVCTADAARLEYLFHDVDHELRPCFQIIQMLEAARRPREVEARQVVRDRAHVAEAMSYALVEDLVAHDSRMA